MAKTIAIKNWHLLYENHETKKYKQLKWVPLPNKHDGEGWGRLWELPDATEIFGAFILMLEIASKCPERGVIHKDGEPITPQGMAYKTKAPVGIFVKAIQPLIDIGWIEIIERPGKSAEICGRTAVELNRIELNRTIDIRHDNPAAPLSLPEIIAKNYPKQADGMLSDLKSMPRLAEKNLTEEGVYLAVYILKSISAVTKKYPAFKIYAFIQKAINEKYSLRAVAGAMGAIICLTSPPHDMAPYWTSLLKNPKVMEEHYEKIIWPEIKKEKLK